MSLLNDLQALGEHLTPSDIAAGDRVVGALIKVLEHQGLEVPTIEELLPEEHPARIAPPAPTAPPQDTSGLGSRLDRLEGLLGELLGHKTSPQVEAEAGSETHAPSSEPAPPAPESAPPAPELDRP